jgi:hypothetical protein
METLNLGKASMYGKVSIYGNTTKIVHSSDSVPCMGGVSIYGNTTFWIVFQTWKPFQNRPFLVVFPYMETLFFG